MLRASTQVDLSWDYTTTTTLTTSEATIITFQVQFSVLLQVPYCQVLFFSQLFPSIMSTSLSFCKWVHQELSADTTNVFSARVSERMRCKESAIFWKNLAFISHIRQSHSTSLYNSTKLIPTDLTDVIFLLPWINIS